MLITKIKIRKTLDELKKQIKVRQTRKELLLGYIFVYKTRIK